MNNNEIIINIPNNNYRVYEIKKLALIIGYLILISSLIGFIIYMLIELNEKIF